MLFISVSKMKTKPTNLPIKQKTWHQKPDKSPWHQKLHRPPKVTTLVKSNHKFVLRSLEKKKKKASLDDQKSLMTQATSTFECPNIDTYGNKVIQNYQCFWKIQKALVFILCRICIFLFGLCCSGFVQLLSAIGINWRMLETPKWTMP